MQNLKLIQNKIYKIKYTINDTEYFSFCTFTGDHYFLDVITNKLFDIKDITYIDHTKIDHKIIKYFTKLYKKENNISIFKSSTVYDLNLQLYVNVLRFFDLKDQDLIQNNKEKYLKDKIINKCRRYLKRYLDPSILNDYINTLNNLDDINHILSFKPQYCDHFFWSKLYISATNSDYTLYDVNNSIFDTFNKILNLNINDFLIDKQKYKRYIDKKLEDYQNNLQKEYKEKVTNILNEKILKAKNTIDNEIEYAILIDDADLLFELDVLKETIAKNSIDIIELCKNVNIQTDFNLLWPELLYPIDDITIDDYFHNNKHINIIKKILSEI
jgi:hypothetical protein